MYQGFEYARMPNISGFWICQGSKYTRVLNMPGLWIYQCYEYVSVLNMLGFWIYQGSEYTWFTQASECAWTSLENSWVGLIISEYAWIYLNISAYVWISLNLSELIFFYMTPLQDIFYLNVWLLVLTKFIVTILLFCRDCKRLRIFVNKISSLLFPLGVEGWEPWIWLYYSRI